MNSDLQIILWAMGGGFAGTWMMMFFLFGQVNDRLKRLEEKVENVDKRLCIAEVKLNDIDRRLCRIEDSLSYNGHCLFKQSQEKAE